MRLSYKKDPEFDYTLQDVTENYYPEFDFKNAENIYFQDLFDYQLFSKKNCYKIQIFFI